MDKIKIAICDNESIICTDLSKMIYNAKSNVIIKIFNSSEQLLSSNEDFAIYFLDIKGVNGLFIANTLRKRQQHKSIIIFITGYREYMEAAFDINAYHYLIKPIEPAKFNDIFNRAYNEVVQRRILIKTGDLQYSISIDDILFIESSNKKVIMHTVNNIYEVYGTMDYFENELNDKFYRCHRCYLVNLDKITAYNSDNIKLINGDNIILSRKRYNEFVKSYLRYIKH